MDSSVSPKDEILFLRVCSHISTGHYPCPVGCISPHYRNFEISTSIILKCCQCLCGLYRISALRAICLILQSKHVQCIIGFCLMTYQHFQYMCLLINDSACGFIYDGTPPHFLRIVWQRLNHTGSRQWIGHEDPVNC